MRASEMRNWPISKPKNSDLNQSRISAPEKPHCSMRTGRAHTASTIPSGELGQSRELVPARLIEPEPALQHRSERVTLRRGLPRQGANGEIEQHRDQHHDAGHDQLLGDKPGQGHVSGERAGDDADDDEPQRDFQPARLVPGQTFGDPRRRRLEAREKQRDEQDDVGEVRDEGLQNCERERHEERPRHLRERNVEGINAGDALQQPANAPRTSIRQVEEAPLRLVYREHGGQQRADCDEEKKPLDQAGRKPIPRLIQQIECVEAAIEQEACEQNGCGARRRRPGRGNRALDEGRRGLARRPPRNAPNGILGNEIEKQRSSQQGADALVAAGRPNPPSRCRDNAADGRRSALHEQRGATGQAAADWTGVRADCG